MQETGQIAIEAYDYALPDERIARYPVTPRDSSKLLVYRSGHISSDVFTSLPDYLPEGALMVYNNTKVIRARLHFRKATGALIEIFCLEPHRPADYQQIFAAVGRCTWLCLVGNAKKWKGEILQQTLVINGQEVKLTAQRGDTVGTSTAIHFTWSGDGITFADVIDAAGELPIPPYLNRATEQTDLDTYQTVYSKVKGSVAAPTAGLHFTDRVLAAIDAKGIERDEITLHVGAGTFKPVKATHIADHEMHTEWIAVSKSSILKLMAHGGSCIAVGTTSVRTLESLYYIGSKLLANPDLSEEELAVKQWEPYAADAPDVSVIDALQAIVRYLDMHETDVLHTGTQIIIAPGYRYRIVRMIVTNFHQPKSTLLLLVSAFLGEQWHKVYDYALEHDFRFLSYGDSSLLIP